MNKFVFFGTSRFSLILLRVLKNKFEIIPTLIVTQPDRPKGRKQIMTSSEVKLWSEENGIEVFQPRELDDLDTIRMLQGYDFFVVASYGKIIPKSILGLPKNGTLNVHPSLLPRYRGASPIQTQILNGEKDTGTTIMLMDEKMDHGDIIKQKKVNFKNPFIGNYEEVEERMAIESAELLSQVMRTWPEEKNSVTKQDHHSATYTSIIKKEDGLIELNDDPQVNYRKYLAYHHWPKIYFYTEIQDTKNNIKKRNIITKAEFVDDKFKVLRIITEGKKETDYKPAV